MAPTNQALTRSAGGHGLAERPTPIDGVITTVQDLADQVQKASERFHVVSPVVQTSSLAAGYGASMSVVNLDLSGRSADVYHDNLMKADEVALTKISLMRISAALGISWTETKRIDNGTRRHYWNVAVKGVYRAADGTMQTISASKEVDFTDGSPQIAGKSDKEVARMRMHGHQLAETKAQLRAVRSLGIKQKYTREELQKPFLCVRFSFMPDMNDPEVKRMVTAEALGISHQIYGAQTERPSLPPGQEDLPAELGGRGGNQAAATSAAKAAPKEATFDDDEPEPDDRPRHGVAHVLERTTDGDWPVQLTDGTTLLTNDKSIARAASEAGKAGKAVVLESAKGRIEELTVLDESAPATAAATGGHGNGGGDDDAPADDGQRYVKKVKEAVRTGKNDRGPWTLSFVVLSTGEEVSTFSSTDVAKAKEAEAKGWPVRVQIDDSDPERPRLSSIELIDPRQGSLLNDGKGAKY